MIDVDSIFTCDRCGRTDKKKFVLNEQGLQSFDSHIPVSWDFVQIQDVRFLVCDVCLISLVLSMLNQGKT